MGDVHVGVVDREGQLEVEINQARGLTPKPGSKNIPTTYVKVYVLENGACLAKKKTRVIKKSLDPSFQQSLLFDESPQGKVLQVIVWGDYGRMDTKCFMGMAQIMLEDLDLSSMVSGWYKLFPTSSLADPSIGPLTPADPHKDRFKQWSSTSSATLLAHGNANMGNSGSANTMEHQLQKIPPWLHGRVLPPSTGVYFSA
ncbi:hypothetical protein AALO_G00260750 [Alosa alosa]|uniref:C2 domain-containing protein n=1 Tax=Alosa alosa TaxID=278164 RepID=A0AAV6FTI4_9TELE|nr:hypothetical protein AALO_G00260750 [Alosa alosa]